jgi:hypothetical protein
MLLYVFEEPEIDMFGAVRIYSPYLVCVGALLSFAGALLLTNLRYKLVGHLPFLLFLVVVYAFWSSE